MTRSSDEQFGDLSRLMSAEANVQLTSERAVAIAVDLIDGCDAASICVVGRRRQVTSEVATDDQARRADELQQELGEGPVLDSVAEHDAVYSAKLATEQRWPVWSQRVHEGLGLRSVLSLQLFVTEHTIGALSLYSSKTDAFDTADRPTALALAAHVAVAIYSAHDKENLQQALINRVVIGQAEGMLMQRFGISPDQAFSVLVRASQTTNRRLATLADQIVREGLDSLALAD